MRHSIIKFTYICVLSPYELYCQLFGLSCTSIALKLTIVIFIMLPLQILSSSVLLSDVSHQHYVQHTVPKLAHKIILHVIIVKSYYSIYFYWNVAFYYCIILSQVVSDKYPYLNFLSYHVVVILYDYTEYCHDTAYTICTIIAHLKHCCHYHLWLKHSHV